MYAHNHKSETGGSQLETRHNQYCPSMAFFHELGQPVGDPSFIGPILAGVLVWAGLYLRDGRLIALIPGRR